MATGQPSSHLDAAQIRDELQLLTKGRGVQRGDVESHVGHHLAALVGIETSDGPVVARQRLISWLTDNLAELPEDLHVVVRAAFGLGEYSGQPLQAGRVTQLAETQDWSERTARRRISQTVQMIADLARDATLNRETEQMIAKSGRDASGRGHRGRSLVGRSAERHRLLDFLDSAANRQPVTLFISGDAGVGKTSLLDWFADEAQDRGALVLKGSCIELGGGATIPYGALTEALRLFVRSEGVQQAQRLAGGAWSVLDGLITDSGESDTPTSTADSQIRIFGALLRLSDNIGRRAPLILIFEDIHWADASTLDVIRYLTKAKTDQQLMLLCSFRPMGAHHQLRDLLAEVDFQRRIQSISLAPFSRSELDVFASLLAGRPVAKDRLERYFELSEGNPYFAEQLIMADDPYKSDVEVPQSLRGLMTDRLTQLSDDAAEVVAIAAVVGRRLDDNLLEMVSGLDEHRLERALRECIHQRILVPDGTDDAYTFQHALLRATAYRDLLPRTRKRVHTRIAEALAETPGGQTRFAGEVAFHWFEAGQLPQAFAAALRAADQATRIHAYPEAVAQYERSLAMWLDIPDAQSLAGESREQILGRAADAARWGDRVNRALDWVQEAIAEVDAGAAPGRAGELQERLGSYLWEVGQYDGAATAYAAAAALLSSLPPSAAASRVQAALAVLATRFGNYADGTERAQLAVDLARAAGARAEEGRGLNFLGLSMALNGRAVEGEKALREALAIAVEIDHLDDLFRAYGNLGVCLELAGRVNDAVTALAEGLERAKENGLLGTRQSGVLANNAGAALSSLGLYDQATTVLDSVMLDRSDGESIYARLTRAEIAIAQGAFADAESLLEEIRSQSSRAPRVLARLYVNLAEAAAWQGNLEQARELVDRGRQETASTATAQVVVQLCATGLRIAADLRDGAWADELAAAARSAAESHEADEIQLLARLCDAELARVTDKDSVEMWAKLVDGWGLLHQLFRCAYAQARLAGAAARRGDREQASAAVQAAYTTATEIGAEPLREHIEKLGLSLRLRLGSARPYGLTQMELAILRELTSGTNNAQIAQTLFMSPHSVSVHVSNILRKMGAKTRTEAIGKAQSGGILTDVGNKPTRSIEKPA